MLLPQVDPVIDPASCSAPFNGGREVYRMNVFDGLRPHPEGLGTCYFVDPLPMACTAPSDGVDGVVRSMGMERVGDETRCVVRFNTATDAGAYEAWERALRDGLVRKSPYYTQSEAEVLRRRGAVADVGNQQLRLQLDLLAKQSGVRDMESRRDGMYRMLQEAQRSLQDRDSELRMMNDVLGTQLTAEDSFKKSADAAELALQAATMRARGLQGSRDVNERARAALEAQQRAMMDVVLTQQGKVTAAESDRRAAMLQQEVALSRALQVAREDVSKYRTQEAVGAFGAAMKEARELGYKESQSRQDCELGAWGPWGACSAACGGGQMTRTRPVVKPAMNGGQACGPATEQGTCNTNSCRQDCGMSGWYAVTACQASCGFGQQQFARDILSNPVNGGAACPQAVGSKQYEWRQCHSGRTCPRNCVADVEEGVCNNACGWGQKYVRVRSISQQPDPGGSACPQSGYVDCYDTSRCFAPGMPGGSYAQSCTGCYMSGSTLYCHCSAMNGSSYFSIASGCSRYGNNNGALVCE